MQFQTWLPLYSLFLISGTWCGFIIHHFYSDTLATNRTIKQDMQLICRFKLICPLHVTLSLPLSHIHSFLMYTCSHYCRTLKSGPWTVLKLKENCPGLPKENKNTLNMYINLANFRKMAFVCIKCLGVSHITLIHPITDWVLLSMSFSLSSFYIYVVSRASLTKTTY